jgi:hypothetical protein
MRLRYERRMKLDYFKGRDCSIQDTENMAVIGKEEKMYMDREQDEG